MKVLFIGGTGTISSACSDLALERGIELWLFNRGRSERPVPKGAHVIHGDISDGREAQQALAGQMFDAVVDWVAYRPEQVQRDMNLFNGRTGQYIFISSASAYQKPPASLPITESTPLYNPFWQYSRDKIACEDALMHAYRQTGFPVTIVRPSHTYDKTYIPLNGRYTVIDRMRRGKKVLVHGDGTSLWVMTNHRDLAKGFVGLLCNPRAIGEAYHITSDEIITWNQIYTLLGHAAGVQPQLIHMSSEVLAAHYAAYNSDWGDGLLGDKAHSVLFDNTKIKRAVPGFVATIPFAEGAREIMAWYDADAARRVVDPVVDDLFDRIVGSYKAAWPSEG